MTRAGSHNSTWRRCPYMKLDCIRSGLHLAMQAGASVLDFKNNSYFSNSASSTESDNNLVHFVTQRYTWPCNQGLPAPPKGLSETSGFRQVLGPILRIREVPLKKFGNRVFLGPFFKMAAMLKGEITTWHPISGYGHVIPLFLCFWGWRIHFSCLFGDWSSLRLEKSNMAANRVSKQCFFVDILTQLYDTSISMFFQMEDSFLMLIS